MSEKLKTWIYTLVIIFIFLLLGLIVWLVYDSELQELDREPDEVMPGKTMVH